MRTKKKEMKVMKTKVVKKLMINLILKMIKRKIQTLQKIKMTVSKSEKLVKKRPQAQEFEK